MEPAQNINVATGDDNIILGFIQCLPVFKRVSCWSLVKYRIDSSQLFQMIFEIILPTCVRWDIKIFDG